MSNLEIALALAPDDPSRQPLLAQMHERLGAADARLGKRAQADKHFGEALRLRTELQQTDAANLSRQAAFALALARAGKCADAAHAARRLRPRVGQSTELLLQLARAWAVCAAVDEDKTKHRHLALEVLRAAAKDGYQDFQVLATDPSFESLRALASFQSLLNEVKARTR